MKNVWFTQSILSMGIHLLAFLPIASGQNQTFEIGVIADCQYCSDPGTGVRKYSMSKIKLSRCVRHFNSLNLSYVIHLGDFIDREYESYEVVKPIYDSLQFPAYHVLGNHDFSVADEYKEEIPQKLGIPNRFDFFDHQGWRFIILDGNDLSFHAYPENAERWRETSRYYEEHKLTSPRWNGAIGDEQLQWLDERLAEAETSGLKVMLYCHFPVFPENIHNLWNANELLEQLTKYSCVKAYVNGHNHEGNYGVYKGIHCLTLKGMVDTEETSYAVFLFSDSTIEVQGFGREQKRTLVLK